MGSMDEIVREFLVESYENLDQLDQDLVALERSPGSRELLSRVFRTIHTIKGACGFLGFGRLESLTHVGESLLSELRDGRRVMDQRTTDVLLHMVDTVREILASIEASGGEGDIVVDGVIEQIRAVLQEPAARTAPDVDPLAGTGLVADEPGPVSASDSAIRVDIEVLDALMRQVGELVLARNQITLLVGGQLDADLMRSSQRLSLITSELHESVMKARMQPIGHLWVKMPRVVRDLAADCGRQVRLEVVGGDTELDRALLEAVKDPLMHLVRNAVDHGIEDVKTRVAAGKPAEGLLTIRAQHAGGRVIIEVEDDGKGIDADRVAAVAVARGLRTPNQVAAMSAIDLLRLLFLPGFSMADAVTNVSGRGVGLDVVHTNIEAIGGTVEKEYLVEARLQPIVRQIGMAGVDEYVDTLRMVPHGVEHDRVVEALTTNETSWFRDFTTFQILIGYVVPALVQDSRAPGPLRVWSAGCSTGQEPYSIAMALLDAAPGRTVEITATDISQEALRRGRAGRYSQLEINRGLPAQMLVRHFTRAGTEWELSEDVRSKVTFSRHNLLDPPPPGGPFDIIFLRYVLIYFDPQTRREVLRRVRSVLTPGGFLLLGAAEVIGVGDG